MACFFAGLSLCFRIALSHTCRRNPSPVIPRSTRSLPSQCAVKSGVLVALTRSMVHRGEHEM
jgi:hypothetical protein